MITVIRYRDIENLNRIKPPLFFYGRRKTGKTHLVKNYFRDSEYFFVKRDRTIFWESRKKALSYTEFMSVLDLLSDVLVIVDEFHRLPGDFLDYVHINQPRNLILVTSTLFLARKMLSEKSPLLGNLLEYRVDLIDERDILLNLSEHFEGRELVEKAVFLREPILLQWGDLNLFEIIKRLRLTVPSLMGEVFLEEDRKLTERYEGILRAVAYGKQKVNEITNYLYSRGLIDTPNPSHIKVYVKNLIEMGLLKRYREYGREKYHYFIASPIIDLYLYLDEKYNFSEEDLDEKYLVEKMPFYVEDFFRHLFARMFKLRTFMIRRADMEMDIVLGDFRKVKIVGEVKWKKRVGRDEIRKISEKFQKFRDSRKILIVPDDSCVERVPDDVEIWDVERILRNLRGA